MNLIFALVSILLAIKLSRIPLRFTISQKNWCEDFPHFIILIWFFFLFLHTWDLRNVNRFSRTNSRSYLKWHLLDVFTFQNELLWIIILTRLCCFHMPPVCLDLSFIAIYSLESFSESSRFCGVFVCFFFPPHLSLVPMKLRWDLNKNIQKYTKNWS